MKRSDIRNVAIIAHVDHGKTTLVDKMMKFTGLFRSNEVVEERILDSNELEKERGITILAKNTSVRYNGVKINIVDTPGHADFGGEVERIMNMVDGVLLLVDAFEGPMPQTRFVLKKALDAGLKPIVVINKIDRPDARPHEVVDEVLDLFIDLGADDDQLEFPVVYASAKLGVAALDPSGRSDGMKPLFDTILSEIPAPEHNPDGTLRLLISSIDYDSYVGRIGIGKITRGSIAKGREIAVCDIKGTPRKVKTANIYTFEGLKRAEVEEAYAGEIVAVTGIDDINIGQTLCSPDNPDPLPFVKIDEPTLSMNFMVNDSPLAGLDGEYVTSRHLKDRLVKELLSNVALRVEETGSPDSFKVSGRGELHLSILIETMRREGYEFAVSRPEVITKQINGRACEPMELLVVEVPEDYMGIVIEKTGSRRGEIRNIKHNSNGTVRMEFVIPSRGLIGYRSEFLTDTKGQGLMHHIFNGYDEYKGDIPARSRGSLVAAEPGISTTYGLYNAQERGDLFIGPGIDVYEGMIVGENSRPGDITINVAKKKHLTNMRSSTADEALRLTPPREMTLEKALEFIADDELVEVTPKSIRLRKRVLDKDLRFKMRKNAG